MIWRESAQVGLVFGTLLMRANNDKVYPKSISNTLFKNRLYLLSIGDEEDEETFWIKGRELATLYADQKGFRVLADSPLGSLILNVIKEEDAEALNKYSSNPYRNVDDLSFHNPNMSDRLFLNTLKETVFPTMDALFDFVKPLGKAITMYRIHTSPIPYYLEEVKSYCTPSTNKVSF